MKNLNENIVKKLKERNMTISFMESCTGGYLSNCITNVNGSSDVLKVSLVTYSNEYKIRFGVPKKIIDKYTVYSMETAKEMAQNICKFANSDYGIGVTGELGNSLKEQNKVYYCIYNNNTNENFEEILLVNPNKRELMKKEVCNIIMSKIITFIN